MIVSLLDRIILTAKTVGAVNVVRREPDGSLVGAMLDGQGFLAGLATLGETAADRCVLLIGAGGASTAMAGLTSVGSVRSARASNVQSSTVRN